MSFDAPDPVKKVTEPDDVVGLAKLSGQAFLHSAIQSPMEGVTQLVNKVADRELLPCPKFIDAPDPAQFGSKAWFAETIGSGLGMVAPFLLTEKVSGSMLNKAGLLPESAAMSGRLGAAGLGAAEVAEVGRIGSAIRFSTPAARMAVAGALFGLVLTPSLDPTRDFWEQRGVSAASSAITFGAMGLTSRGLTAGIESKLKVALTDSAMQSSLEGIGIRIGTNAIGGAVGGVVSAESNSLLSGKGFASQDEVMRSVASYMVTGAGLDAAHIAMHKGGELLARNDGKNLESGERVAPKLSPEEQQMLDKIQRAHFEYFKQQSDPETGLTKDRSTDTSPASIAAVGFSLTAHPVAVSRGWIGREEATDYTLKVLKNLSESPQGPDAKGTSGDHGFFYHFLDPKTGLRQGENELSTVDTALLMGGVLFAKNFYDGNNPKEVQIRELADNLYKRVDWPWALNAEGREQSC
ncbi:MAG: hypothetical protein HYX67_02535 [Candidatus Melainabacteria bacterium]|nr:hypothetical protein [Candidatus Melainabacteria bacterium]